MKLQAWSGEPVVVEFNYLKDSRGKTPAMTHEIRVMRRYPAVSLTQTRLLGCDCPRVVKPDCLVVWHSPECLEIDRDA